MSARRRAAAAPSSSSSSSSQPSSLLQAYLDLLSSHPLTVNGIQSAGITVVSIHFTKYFSSSTSPQPYSQLHESMCMFIVSSCLITPCIYNFNKRVISRMRSHILVKVALDQFCFSPLLTFMIISSRQILLDMIQQRDILIFDTCTASLKILPNILVNGWLFWLPVKFLSLHYVPFRFQLLFSSLVACGWNIILSLMLR